MLFRFDEDTFQRILKHYLTESQISFLKKQGIKHSMDILLLQPKRYDIRRYDVKISNFQDNQKASIIGKLRQFSRRTVRKNLTVVNAVLNTESDHIPVVWFNQLYILDRLKNDPFVVLNGVFESSNIDMVFKVSNIEICSSFKATLAGKVCPIYPEFRGVSDKKIRSILLECLDKYETKFRDYLPHSIIQQDGLLGCCLAIRKFHFPQNQLDLTNALKRFKFDELFSYLFPRRYRHYQKKSHHTSVKISLKHSLMDKYLAQLPYALTSAQQRVWDNIYDDLLCYRSVYRLIQGDVGSGKTDIAILSILAAVGSGYKGAILVPTEILAQQHYYKCLNRCENMDVEILLLKGRLSKKKKQLIYDQLQSNDSLIIVGTHALLQEAVKITNLGLIVIDEQHRFGVFQRQSLLSKSEYIPHCLFMTATPIPRTLMLTHYGDLDHDVIDELPPGRHPPKTYYGKLNRMSQIYEFIRLELNQGRQAYIVFPLIEESEHLDLQNAVDGYEFISEYLSEFRVGLLHGRMKDDEKVKIMDAFKTNALQILVSTTVIEVGVDVPNATVMIIMNAERFGLSQLHQLRGRVGRGADQSHCFLVADPKSDESRQRIQAMLDTTNGFKLAEIDLKIRGPGNLLGTQQSGDLVFSFANILDKAYVQRVLRICDNVIANSEQYLDLYSLFEAKISTFSSHLN